MRDTFKYKTLFEFFVVAILIGICLSKMLFVLTSGAGSMPHSLDNWHVCASLEYQVKRILGQNPGGLWEGGMFYPFDKYSLFFDEPRWGISLVIAPLWLLTENIFLIYSFGGVVSLFLAWLCVYFFVKNLGVKRRYAFFAGTVFCLSGICFVLLFQSWFWAFFIIPLLGLVTMKLFSTEKWRWSVLWGLLYGYLAWSSMHLFLMGSVFLFSFILWHLVFKGASKKMIVLLSAAFLLGGLIAGMVVWPMYMTHERFGFFRNCILQYEWATNWANLVYKGGLYGLSSLYNPFAKTDLWKQLGAHVKGGSNIGISIFVFAVALILFIVRFKEEAAGWREKKRAVLTFLFLMGLTGGLAWLNVHCMETVREQYIGQAFPSTDVALTCFYYFTGGIIIYVFRRRLRSAVRHLDFYLLLVAVFFGFLAFGPYYPTPDGAVISPVAFLMYGVSGFSGLGETSRWGLMLSFTLSVAVAVFLSQYNPARKWKSIALFCVLFLFCFLELSPGIKLSGFHKTTPYQWEPKEIDIFLRDLPDGAILEMRDYPPKTAQDCFSDDCQGARLFARTFHQKPLVNGYATHIPTVLSAYLYSPAALSSKSIRRMRKLGARYWVVRMREWPEDRIRLFQEAAGELKQIASFNDGKTVIYEDPDPKIKVPTKNRNLFKLETGEVDVSKISRIFIERLYTRGLKKVSRVTSIDNRALENFKKIFSSLELQEFTNSEGLRALNEVCGEEARTAGVCIEYHVEDEDFFASGDCESKDFVFNIVINGEAKGALRVFFPAEGRQPIMTSIVKASVMLPKEGNPSVYTEVSKRIRSIE